MKKFSFFAPLNRHPGFYLCLWGIVFFGFFLEACAPDQGTDTQQGLPSFNCETGEPDWVLAKAFSPDVISPCNAGSTGICKSGYTYVSGTGWCRPIP